MANLGVHPFFLTFGLQSALSLFVPVRHPHVLQQRFNFHSLRGMSSSLMITISPTSTLCLGACHRCRKAMCARYSFLHLWKNCSDRYWPLLHLQVFLAELSRWGKWNRGFHSNQIILCEWLQTCGIADVIDSEWAVIYNGHSFIKDCP